MIIKKENSIFYNAKRTIRELTIREIKKDEIIDYIYKGSLFSAKREATKKRRYKDSELQIIDKKHFRNIVTSKKYKDWADTVQIEEYDYDELDKLT